VKRSETTHKVFYSLFKCFTIFVAVECHRIEQHSEREEGDFIFQSSSKSRIANDDGTPEGSFHQEQFQVPQGQNAKS
jgi:hypothetical protein